MHRNPKWTGETAGSYHALLQSLTRRILMYLHGKEEDLLVTCKEDRVALLSFTNVIDILKEQHHGMSRPYYKTKKNTQCPEVVANSNSASSSSFFFLLLLLLLLHHLPLPLLLHVTLEKMMFHSWLLFKIRL
jgi:hypothetical protein